MQKHRNTKHTGQMLTSEHCGKKAKTFVVKHHVYNYAMSGSSTSLDGQDKHSFVFSESMLEEII